MYVHAHLAFIVSQVYPAHPIPLCFNWCRVCFDQERDTRRAQWKAEAAARRQAAAAQSESDASGSEDDLFSRSSPHGARQASHVLMHMQDEHVPVRLGATATLYMVACHKL
jgi:hypothetical protein